MTIFLYGPNTYLSRKALREIVLKYQKIYPSRGLISRIECSRLGPGESHGILRQPSLITDRRLIIFADPFSSPDLKKFILENNDALAASQDTIVFYDQRNPDPKDALFLFLQKHAECRAYPKLNTKSIKLWLTQEAKSLGLWLDVAAVDVLIGSFGGDPWRLDHEVRKLAAFAGRKKIGMEDLGRLCGLGTEGAIFEALDALGAKDRTTAVTVLRQRMAAGDSPSYLLSMLAFQFRNFLLIKDAMLAGRKTLEPSSMPDMHPYVFQKTRRLAEFFTFAELKKTYKRIFLADIAIKKGTLDPQAAIDFIVAGI